LVNQASCPASRQKFTKSEWEKEEPAISVTCHAFMHPGQGPHPVD
jgi:hypothetical protein